MSDDFLWQVIFLGSPAGKEFYDNLRKKYGDSFHSLQKQYDDFFASFRKECDKFPFYYLLNQKDDFFASLRKKYDDFSSSLQEKSNDFDPSLQKKINKTVKQKCNSIKRKFRVMQKLNDKISAELGYKKEDK